MVTPFTPHASGVLHQAVRRGDLAVSNRTAAMIGIIALIVLFFHNLPTILWVLGIGGVLHAIENWR